MPRQFDGVWVDLDGVLANFTKRACQVLDIPYPDRTVFDRTWLPRATGLSPEEFIPKINAVSDFWETIEPTASMAELVTLLDVNYPDWRILTCAMRDKSSWSGKADWVRKYLGNKGLHRLTVMHGAKGVFARPNALLIDDHRKHCDEWECGRGESFHFLEASSPWPEWHELQMRKLKAFLHVK